MKRERIILIMGVQSIYEVDASDKNLEVKKFSPHAPMRGDTFITFQPDELINQIGTDAIQKIDILDFECLDKQIRQSIGPAAIKEKWSVANMLATYLDEKEKKWQEEEYAILLKKLAQCYCVIKEKGKDEWLRITEIEIPINRILYEVQSKGIFFKHDEIEPLCEKLHKRIYEQKNRIQLNLGYAGDDLISYMNIKGMEYHLSNNPSDLELKNICKKVYPELEPFWKAMVEERNLRCLMYLSAGRLDSDVCRPLFKGFGSSTGRIFLRDPALQNLSRKFRKLLKEDLEAGWRYEYIDFGQFEAGILAGISNNQKLQSLYENDCIYEKLAEMSKTNRDEAKIMFYCFVYGGIISKGAENFFKVYNLKDTVEQEVEKAFQQGYVETALGNRRVVTCEDDKKWILNHFIQGTASLIFKQALINVNAIFSNTVKLVLPVHDAALFKVYKDVETNRIIEQFEQAFVKWIPGSKPVVRIKEFFEGE